MEVVQDEANKSCPLQPQLTGTQVQKKDKLKSADEAEYKIDDNLPLESSLNGQQGKNKEESELDEGSNGSENCASQEKSNQSSDKKRNFYACDVCNKRFLYRCLLKRHHKSHTGCKPFECDVCNKCFFKKTTLRKHVEIQHPNARNRACQICKKIFGRTNHLVKHMASHVFTCDICNQNFKTERLLTKHHKIHSSNQPFKCQVCVSSSSFSEYSALRKHLLIEHSNLKLLEEDESSSSDSNASIGQPEAPISVKETSDRKYPCRYCGKEFLRKYNMQEHVKLHTGERPFKCHVCNSSFVQIGAKKKHYRENHPEVQLLNCNVCHKTFFEENSLEEHKKRHVTDCDVCGKSFKNSTYLRRHYEMHTVEEPMKCEFCSMSYNLYHSLRTHILNSHPEAKPKICEICHEGILDSYALKKHIAKHSSTSSPTNGHKNADENRSIDYTAKSPNGEDIPYKCSFCDEIFDGQNELEVHWKIHTKKQCFMCDECGVTFQIHAGLKIHKMIHTGEKPYECEFCHKRFIQKSGLTCHRRTHTREKPHQCDICQQRFSSKSGMRSHRRTHTGEKPYSCDYCEKTFRTASVRLSHIRRHTGEKPYHCKYCHLKFVESHGLKRHLLVHSGEKPIICEVCGKGFTQSYNLKVHMKSHTMEKIFSAQTLAPSQQSAHKSNDSSSMLTQFPQPRTTAPNNFVPNTLPAGTNFQPYNNMVYHNNLPYFPST